MQVISIKLASFKEEQLPYRSAALVKKSYALQLVRQSDFYDVDCRSKSSFTIAEKKYYELINSTCRN